MSDTRRDQLVDFVEKEFIGPDPVDWPGMIQSDGEEILRTDPPRTRYIAGILYPRETKEENIDPGEEESLLPDSDEKIHNDISPARTGGALEFPEDAEELINRSNAYRQSAMSLTVSLKKNDAVHAKIHAGIYKKEINIIDGKKKDVWLRSSIDWDNNGKYIPLPSAEERIYKIPVRDTGLQFDIAYRYDIDDNIIYTYTLENTKQCKERIEDSECFFQTRFVLYSEKGFSPLAEGRKITRDDEYLSNQLLYRNIHNYAIGHGTAADWNDNEPVTRISTTTFPVYDMKPIVPGVIDGVSLDMLKMSPLGNFSDTINELRQLCSKYREWIDGLCKIKKTLEQKYVDTANRHIANCYACLSRMEYGVNELETNETIRIAFQYMNLAMLMQQLHYNMPLQRWEDDGKNGIRLVNPVSLPEVSDRNTWGDAEKRCGKWRPFQLAFILMNLQSMNDRNCKERNIVDLIWFPTGGGKTEAYLGLSAYTIFIRRLRDKDDSGTAILMRYTLRLLTAQQYERASSMICACEMIRRKNENLFGKNRITIGLWVGINTTPNKMKDAVKAYDELYRDHTRNNPFIILKCPWCGAQMGPAHSGLPGYTKQHKGRKSFRFAFLCRNSSCDFSEEELPLYVVDESIYEEPPTLLLGTVDKFAMLPFLPEAQSIFGFKEGVKKCSPDLIIQDELHLISGPLGSMVGHYETLIHELCTFRTSSDESGDIHPKIIASTATISRAKEQCQALYGCRQDQVFQFPPPGLDAGNSFFAKEDREQNARRYVGVLATGSSSDATTAIRLYSALLYGAKAMKVSQESERDPYWTNMGYYNSLRELGQAATWIRADIDQHLDVMYKRRFADKRYPTREEYRASRRYIWRDEELTSRISGSEVTASLASLGIAYPGVLDEHGGIREHPIDICLATNMISVGLDIPRLGLMTVSGQPKTTSEYIQATSRVGRNAKDAPGIVFVLYRPGRPRDKSHYEHFRAYHSKVYCHVEPASVTPFSAPVRERALHAVLVGMMRLESPCDFKVSPLPDKKFYERFCHIIEKRVKAIDNDALEATRDEMETFIQNWEDWNPKRWEPKKNSDGSYADDLPLMYPAGSRPSEAWEDKGIETPTSMRNVDVPCEARILHDRYSSDED